MRRLVFISAVVTLLFISCADDPDCGEKTAMLTINATIHNTVIAKQTFVGDDRIGIYLVSYINDTPGILGDVNQTAAVNVEYIYDTSGFWYSNDGTDIFLDQQLSDLYAYHPYDWGMSRHPDKRNLAAYPFQVELDQHAATDHSDFLWAKVPALSEANFTAPIVFQHLMCRCEINIRLADGIETAITPQLQVHNTSTSCTINMRNGQVTPGTGTHIVIPSVNAVTQPGFDFTYDAILVPQSLVTGTPLFTITINDDTYVYELTEDLVMQSQECYKFNLVAGPSAAGRNRISVMRMPG